MRVFIANFGRGNAMWPEARDRPAVTIFNDEGADPFWRAGDRAGYIAYSLANTLTLHDVPPTVPLASRWFNLATIVTQSAGDVWIHREHDELWWTITTDSPAASELRDPPPGVRKAERIVHYAKPALPWSPRARTGTRLSWTGLHPKARTFLFTEGTLQQLAPDNAAYAMALIDGGDLSPWHDSPAWRRAVANAGRGAVTEADARQRAILTMVVGAQDVAVRANGQKVERTAKNKDFAFATRQEAEAYIDGLMRAQDDVCALTGVALEFGVDARSDFKPSLDRIDSAGHYAPGNLQVLCWFANRWKNDDDNANFRQLIDIVRAVG